MSGNRGRTPPQGPQRKSKDLSLAMVRITPALGSLAFLSIFINALRLTIPIYLLQVIDRVVSSESVETLIFITLIAVGALLVSAILSAVTKTIQSRMSLWMEGRLFEPVAKAAIMGKLTNQTNGASALRDLSQLRTFFSGQVMTTLFEVPWTPIFIGIVYYLHPWLGIFSLCIAITLFSLALLNDWMVTEKQQEAQRGQGMISKYVEQALNSFDAVRSMGMVPRFVSRLTEFSKEALGVQGKIDERTGTISSIIRMIRSLAQVGILGLGAYLVLEGETTTGGMIAASILQSLGLSPIDQSINAVRAVRGAKGAFQRVNKQLSAVNTTEDQLHIDEDPAFSISLSQAMYMPPGVGRPVLRPMRFELPAGELLGVFGPGSAGKSTLLKLLCGVLTPTSGSVTLNSLEVSRMIGDELGGLIGYLPQTPIAIQGTIADNISRFGDAEDPKRSAKVTEAAQLAGIHDDILLLPSRYDTMMDEDGLLRLSNSQVQKIFLARAFYGRPRLLVLDEPTTYFDKAGESAFTEAIEEFLERGTTVVAVSQKPQFLKACDKLLLLRDGTIADFGEPGTVLANLSRGGGGGPSARLVDGGANGRKAG